MAPAGVVAHVRPPPPRGESYVALGLCFSLLLNATYTCVAGWVLDHDESFGSAWVCAPLWEFVLVRLCLSWAGSLKACLYLTGQLTLCQHSVLGLALDLPVLVWGAVITGKQLPRVAAVSSPLSCRASFEAQGSHCKRVTTVTLIGCISTEAVRNDHTNVHNSQ